MHVRYELVAEHLVQSVVRHCRRVKRRVVLSRSFLGACSGARVQRIELAAAAACDVPTRRNAQRVETVSCLVSSQLRACARSQLAQT
jgi:hypothetical protein